MQHFRRLFHSHVEEPLATACVRHRALHPKALTGVSTPIITASTFVLPDADTGARLGLAKESPVPTDDGYFYSRWTSPTNQALCGVVSDLEGAKGTWAFASGMAAITSTMLSVVKAGDHIVAPHAVYGGTNEWLHGFAAGLGISTTFVDATNTGEFEAALRPNTALLYAEAMSNPTVRLTDVEAVGALAAVRGIPLVIDATFSTPYHFRALSVPGVTAVINAGTKYFGGHSDLLSGLVSTNDEALLGRLGSALKLFGGVPSPFDSANVIRGLKTFAVRMERHAANAATVAAFLDAHPKVKAVYYPGLPSHPDHDLAKRMLSRGFGGMIAFDVGSVEAGRRVVESLSVITLAVSLGSVESLCEHPASMTHAMVPAADRLAGGITDGLIRLSVGVEDVASIVGDLEQALKGL